MKVLVTAGPTREPIDPVRFVSNRSSGKMGYAVAEAALRAGHRVRLVTGPAAIAPPAGAKVARVETAEEMVAAVERHLDWCDVLVMAAAVADWRPKNPARQKLKKSGGPPRIEWEPTPDVLRAVAGRKKPTQVFCGFAAETERVAAEAKRKLRAKNLDAIAANDVSKRGLGFEADRNALTIFCASGRTVRVPAATKRACAKALVALLENEREKKLEKRSKIY